MKRIVLSKVSSILALCLFALVVDSCSGGISCGIGAEDGGEGDTAAAGADAQ